MGQRGILVFWRGLSERACQRAPSVIVVGLRCCAAAVCQFQLLFVTSIIPLLIASLTLLLAGCSKHAVQYGQIYESHQGTNDDYYARSNSDGAFNYWMYGGGDNNFSGGQWTRVPASSVPSNLKATDKVV